MNGGDVLIRRDDDRGVFSVHRSVYTDEKLLAVEQARIFERSWLYAAHVSELKSKGDFIARKLANRRIFLMRGSDGQIRAFYNACTHKGAMLCREENGNSRLLICPYHAWSFDDLGELRGVPSSDAFGPYFDKKDFSLTQVGRVDVCAGFIFVSFAEDGDSLRDFLAGSAEYLEILNDGSSDGMSISSGSFKYSIEANWKLLMENSTDAYHVPITHKRFIDYLNASTRNDSDPFSETSVKALGNGHCVLRVHRPKQGKLTALWEADMPEQLRPLIENRRQAITRRHGKTRAREICDYVSVLQIFPNLLVMESQSISIRQFFPRSAGGLDVNIWSLLPSELDPTEREFALRAFTLFWGPAGLGSADDVDILESCQAAFANRVSEWSLVSRGMLNDRPPRFDDDFAGREFWKRWAETMGLNAGRFAARDFAHGGDLDQSRESL